MLRQLAVLSFICFSVSPARAEDTPDRSKVDDQTKAVVLKAYTEQIKPLYLKDLDEREKKSGHSSQVRRTMLNAIDQASFRYTRLAMNGFTLKWGKVEKAKTYKSVLLELPLTPGIPMDGNLVLLFLIEPDTNTVVCVYQVPQG